MPVVAGLLLLALAGCAKTVVPPVRDASFVPEPDEMEMWKLARKVDEHLDEGGLIHRDERLDALVAGVQKRLLPQLGAPDAAVRVYVLEDPFLNAFAMPNGSVYIHSGLLARLDNEDQLAALLGHELTHYLRRHALRSKRSEENRRTVALAVGTVLAVAAAAVSGSPSAARALLDVGDTIADPIVGGYPRLLEREADARGFAAMAAAGYDPREAPRMFHLLRADEEAEGGVVEPYYFGSHPSLDERIESYNERLAERGLVAADEASSKRSPEFAAAVSQLLLRNAALDADLGRFARAHASIDRHLAGERGSAAGLVALGDLHLRQGDGAEQQQAALAAYAAAVEAQPTFAPAHRARGLALRDAGRSEEAAAALARYLELEPTAVDAPIIRGYLTEAGGALGAAPRVGR